MAWFCKCLKGLTLVSWMVLLKGSVCEPSTALIFLQHLVFLVLLSLVNRLMNICINNSELPVWQIWICGLSYITIIMVTLATILLAFYKNVFDLSFALFFFYAYAISINTVLSPNYFFQQARKVKLYLFICFLKTPKQFFQESSMLEDSNRR